MFGKHSFDVMVVGGGPVGLFGGLCLAQKGVDSEVVDMGFRTSAQSYACALHPSSLELLDGCGVADDLVKRGRRVSRVTYRGDSGVLGHLDLESLGGKFPFLLVVPQHDLEVILQDAVNATGKGRLKRSHQVMGFRDKGDSVHVEVAKLDKAPRGYAVAHTEWEIARVFEDRTKYLIGADGVHSLIRRRLGAALQEKGETGTFAVFEFHGDVDEIREAVVAFHRDTANVLWPIGPDRARWSFQIPNNTAVPLDMDHLRDFIASRAPWFEPTPTSIAWGAIVPFTPRVADRAGEGRVWLAGDAVHTTGPVGIQSMNVGLHEVHDLAERTATMVEGKGSTKVFKDYDKSVKKRWKKLLGGADALEVTDDAPDWVREDPGRLLATIPGSGEDLDKLLGQLGLKLK
ncbi:MAG: FAD-dependent oxidoreductase [Myxococcota bacterium]